MGNANYITNVFAIVPPSTHSYQWGKTMTFACKCAATLTIKCLRSTLLVQCTVRGLLVIQYKKYTQRWNISCCALLLSFPFTLIFHHHRTTGIILIDPSLSAYLGSVGLPCLLTPGRIGQPSIFPGMVAVWVVSVWQLVLVAFDSH